MADGDIEARLKRIEDRHAIEVLKWRYLRACDRKQPEEVRATLTPDAVIDYEGFPLFTDRDRFVAIYEKWGCRPNIVDMHHGQHPIIEVDGDTAKGWFDLYFYQIDTETRRHTQMAVSYEDEFVRTADGWAIKRTVSRRLSMLVSEVDDEAIARVRFAGRSDVAGPPEPPRA